jgi:parvulin-like peptidyl-prolyl isomerase
MRRVFKAINILIATFLLMAATGFAADPPLPRVGGKEAIATVNGDPITAEELNQALGMRHAEMAAENRVGKVDYSEILDRLINSKLILLEARNIGLDELPEVKESVASYSRGALMAVLLKQQTKGIRADESEAEKIFKSSVKEYKLSSLMFGKEEDAKRIEAEIKSGKDFNEIVRKVIAEGIAKGAEEGAYLKQEQLLPEIKSAVSGMEVGTISPIIKVASGFVILKLEEIRFPENPDAREQAKATALRTKGTEIKLQFIADMRKKYVNVKEEVLDGLDYEAEVPGFEAFLVDRRVVAEVKGGEPVTVAELSEAIRKQFFHGTEKAAGKKRINNRKFEVLEGILDRRAVRMEALRQGIETSEAYKEMVGEYQNSVLFGVFLEKVIRPGIRLEEKEIKEYYEKHIAEFSSPEMMRINGLIFSKKERAEEAVRKLQEGTDFSWLRANAEGIVEDNAEELPKFDGNLVVVGALTADLQKIVSGAKPGDFRIYESPEGYFYVLSLRDVIPPKPQPYEEERGKIAEKVAGGKITKELEEYAAKLKKSYPVRIFLKSPGS